MLEKAKFHHVIVATGVVPRSLEGKLEGAELPQVMSYAELLSGEKAVGNTVAVIGAGGIGFDESNSKYQQSTDLARGGVAGEGVETE